MTSHRPAITQENDDADDGGKEEGDHKSHQQMSGLTALFPRLLPGIQHPAEKIYGHTSDCVAELRLI
jgi:hypothetical protein